MTAHRFACTWRSSCEEPAVRRRFDPFLGSHRPACATHIKDATPFELLPLVDPERTHELLPSGIENSTPILGTCARCGARGVAGNAPCPGGPGDDALGRLVREQSRALVAEALDALARGKCPTCGASVEPSKRVGRCLYASCGHRIGQVSR